MARDPQVTSRIMAAVPSKDTEPELLLRRALHKRGLRYRLHDRGLCGRPDLVFVTARVAVFVDGDFWHGHGWAERGFNSFEQQFSRFADPEKWLLKISRNVERDQEVATLLTKQGWHVLRILESQIRRDLEVVADRVASEIRGRKSSR